MPYVIDHEDARGEAVARVRARGSTVAERGTAFEIEVRLEIDERVRFQLGNAPPLAEAAPQRLALEAILLGE